MKMEKSFGEIIRNLRKKQKFTLHQVAETLKIDTSLLSKIEKSNRKPSKQLIKDIAVLFNVSERNLTIASLSDKIVYSIKEEKLANEALKVAEKKIKYLTTNTPK